MAEHWLVRVDLGGRSYPLERHAGDSCGRVWPVVAPPGRASRAPGAIGLRSVPTGATGPVGGRRSGWPPNDPEWPT